MTVPAQDLPPEFTYGFVMGQVILAVGDTNDAGSLPDAKAAIGKVTFAPVEVNRKSTTPNSQRPLTLAIGPRREGPTVGGANPREFHVDHSPLCMIGRSNSHRR